MRTSIAKIKIW
jgi:hypothetical protein